MQLTQETLDKKETYNEAFKMQELDNILGRLNNTAPGPYEVHNEMVKQLLRQTKENILEMLNAYYRESYFPGQWKQSVIIPIAKSIKSSIDPSNYRLILLRNVLCD